MMRHFWLLISGIAWAVMMYFLFEREVLPYLEYQAPPSYRFLLRDQPGAEVRVFSISLGRQHVGDAETLMRPLPSGGHRMQTRMTMRMTPFMRLKLRDDRMFMRNEVEVDAAFQLARFEMEASISGIPVRVRGTREGKNLLVDYRFLRLRDQRVFEFPEDATIADDFFPFQGGTQLEEGKKWKIKMLDVNEMFSLSKSNKLSMTELYAKVVGREIVECLGGRQVLAFKVELRKVPDPLEEKIPDYLVWVDKDGMMVKETKMINRLPCEIVLAKIRRLSDKEAGEYVWSVRPGR